MRNPADGLNVVRAARHRHPPEHVVALGQRAVSESLPHQAHGLAVVAVGMIKRIQIEGRNVLVLDFDDGGLHVVGEVFVRHAVFARAVGVLVHRRDNLHDFPLARQHTAAQPLNRPDAVVLDDDALRLILLVQRFHLLRVHLVRFVEDDDGRVLRRLVLLNALFAADDQRLLPAREVVVRQHGVDELGFAAFEEAGNQVDWCKFLFAHALNSSRSAFSSMCAPMTHRRPV